MSTAAYIEAIDKPGLSVSTLVDQNVTKGRRMNDFRGRLQEAARYAGVQEHQAAIAASLNLSRQTVNRWFHGYEPNAKMVAHIARCWGVDSIWLTNGTGTMLPTPSPDGLSVEERELVRDYRSATPKVRDVIRTMARAVRKSAVTIALVIPPLLAPAPADAGVLHNRFSEYSLRAIRRWFGTGNIVQLT